MLLIFIHQVDFASSSLSQVVCRETLCKRFLALKTVTCKFIWISIINAILRWCLESILPVHSQHAVLYGVVHLVHLYISSQFLIILATSPIFSISINLTLNDPGLQICHWVLLREIIGCVLVMYLDCHVLILILLEIFLLNHSLSTLILVASFQSIHVRHHVFGLQVYITRLVWRLAARPKKRLVFLIYLSMAHKWVQLGQILQSLSRVLWIVLINRISISYFKVIKIFVDCGIVVFLIEGLKLWIDVCPRFVISSFSNYQLLTIFVSWLYLL